ncbi:MAG: hypothetical protein JWM86_1869, partial [Thermoleophilia bacterium]|nr:hypothetical protein [Thermoleophilia bacterium]
MSTTQAHDPATVPAPAEHPEPADAAAARAPRTVKGLRHFDRARIRKQK